MFRTPTPSANSLVNQLKFGLRPLLPEHPELDAESSTYPIGTLGITNLPAGQAGTEFPGATFSATNKFGTAKQYWTGTTTGPIRFSRHSAHDTQQLRPSRQPAVGQGSTLAHLRHLLQWQEINNANPATFTGVLAFTYNGNSTAQFVGSCAFQQRLTLRLLLCDFLLGAVGGTPSLGLQPVSEVGGRYRPYRALC